MGNVEDRDHEHCCHPAILDVKRTQELANLPNQYKKFQRTFGNFSFACGCKLLHWQYVLNLNNKSYDVSNM
jgi:hypothetical protein